MRPAGRRAARWWCSVRRARLHLPARRGRPDRRPGCGHALHVNYGLRDAADADEAHCAEVCERSASRSSRQADAAETGNLQAWAREERYGAAARMARRGRGRGRRAHLHRSGRDDSTAWPPRPAAGRCWACARATTRWSGRCWPSPARRPRRTAPSGASAGGRMRATAQARLPAAGSGWDLVPALRKVHPAAEANVVALAEVLRDEWAALDALVDGVLAGAHGITLARLRELPVALRRLVIQRLADEAAGGSPPGLPAGRTRSRRSPITAAPRLTSPTGSGPSPSAGGCASSPLPC